jgi:WD40 repeat protein
VNSVAFSPDGLKIVSASGDPWDHSGDNSVRIWSVATGQCEHMMTGHS